jgi:hypothetical protein
MVVIANINSNRIRHPHLDQHVAQHTYDDNDTGRRIVCHRTGLPCGAPRPMQPGVRWTRSVPCLSGQPVRHVYVLPFELTFWGE